MARNKIEDLRNLLFEQIEKLMDDESDTEKETARAEAIANLASVIVSSAKVEIDFLKMMGTKVLVPDSFLSKKSRLLKRILRSLCGEKQNSINANVQSFKHRSIRCRR